MRRTAERTSQRKRKIGIRSKRNPCSKENNVYSLQKMDIFVPAMFFFWVFKIVLTRHKSTRPTPLQIQYNLLRFIFSTHRGRRPCWQSRSLRLYWNRVKLRTPPPLESDRNLASEGKEEPAVRRLCTLPFLCPLLTHAEEQLDGSRKVL